VTKKFKANSDTAKNSQNEKSIEAIGEVLNSSVTTLVAQCWQKDAANGMLSSSKPNFGSFIRVDCNESKIEIIAVVYNVITGPLDNVHKPSALGLSRERLRLEQPHIFALLRTEIHAMVVGYIQGDRVFQHLPPQSPEVHDFVYPASDELITEFTKQFDFLRLLSAVTEVPSDELLAAAVRDAYRARKKNYQFLVEAGQALSYLLRGDYDRLICVLRKIRPE